MPAQGMDLRPWIDGAVSNADIIAVAFQEIVPLNAQNVVIGKDLLLSMVLLCVRAVTDFPWHFRPANNPQLTCQGSETLILKVQG